MINYFIVITSIYLILILLFIYGYYKIAVFKAYYKTSDIRFSVIIPFRNEAKHLPLLLESLTKLDYPRDQFECILIDDESTDDSLKIIEHYSTSNLNIQVIQNNRISNSPKKDAINTAISKAKFDWIITTDADCITPKYWLKEFARFATIHHSKMIVGPVTYQIENRSFLENFQLLDFMSLQAATLGGFGIGNPFLCNGANLAYQKEIFLTLNGFQGNSNIASGDDIFLFEKFYRKYPNEVHFLKSKLALVTTFPVKSWKKLINQRMRWAAKSSSYKLIFGKFVGLLVLLMNLSSIASLLFLFWSQENSFIFIFIIISKITIDFLLIKNISTFYIESKKIKNYLFASILYPFFSVFIFFKTLFGKYYWKERMFKR